MVKPLLFLFFIFIILISCSTQPEQVVTIPSEPIAIPSESVTAEASNYSTQLFLVDSLNPKSGFGYNILVDGALFIHQASIPSVSGNKTFDTKEKAESVANLVAQKLKNNIMPPSVSKKELDSLNILTH